MAIKSVTQRPALRLVQGSESAPTWAWFCGHCAARWPGAAPPSPASRVCEECGLGLLLESRDDVIPSAHDAFLVIDGSQRVQAVSSEAESLLDLREEQAVNRPVAELLAPADAEVAGRSRLAAAVADALATDQPVTSMVRPWNTFGVRMRAKIAPCGPPRAVLIVLDEGRPPLRAVRS